ncbi:mucin-12 isoform X2 [Pectinophora gossypiella]|uniref:mucin-12 isoform X2 n=1 Tax=Pectinophora gossypiella TaxID=13191 RepID=UPI00214F33A7|nr:mucin-12 isoform X2 [Pectinophora gossypiella]
MTMESPVRICLGAVLVANLLLLSSTVSGNALPPATTTTVRDDRVTRLMRTNTTIHSRRHKTPDVALNELHPKETVSEEHTEKNAKYKDRGRVRYSSKVTTISPPRRAKSTSTTEAGEAAKLIIVTPTPEVKKPAQIINSMRAYKRTKLPVSSSSTTSMTPTAKAVVKTEEEEEEYEDEEHEEDNNSFEKYTSSKFDSNFFTIPNYNDDFGHDSEGADNKVKSEYSSSPYSTFTSYFPDVAFGPRDNKNDEPFKSESFFDFDSELTTPKHDFFDKKYQEISQSIIKNLESIKVKMPPPNATKVYTVVQDNNGVNTNQSLPTNKSTIVIKNTKEIRVLDNDNAGTNNKELSDVQGTSIYYEMSVLSTETYNIDHTNDDDCDNDTLPNEPTASTSEEKEVASIKATQPTIVAPKKQSEAITTLSSNYLPYSSFGSTIFSPTSPISFSTQHSVISSSTEKTTHSFSTSFSRNRSYSKRLNHKESPNSVTSRTETTNYNVRTPTRKFHYTTPKIKPIWMAPRRNVTRNSYTRPTVPTTIYSEHFDIKDKVSPTTAKPKQSHRTSLTTVSSEIDPVLQSDVSGVKKVVHSQSISDNSIPTLWKRGSTKFSTSTATSSETEDGVSDLEIPPTLTAWALASLRSPPPAANPVNTTTSTQKSVDENELQKVGELTDKKETSGSSTTTTTTVASVLNNDIISEKITEIDQNRLPWRPVPAPAVATSEKTEAPATESKSERLPAESNISIQSSVQPLPTTEKMKVATTNPATDSPKDSEEWVSATVEEQTTTEALEVIPPVDATKSTGFESITKLPAGLTTPQDETFASAEQTTDVATEPVPTTTDYEITTIRFSYVPTESTESVETDSPAPSKSTWHAVYPTRTKLTTIKDEPITTYRPKYITTTNDVEETTTIMPKTTPQMDVSSQAVENITESAPDTTVIVKDVTEITTETPTTKPTTTDKIIHEETTEMPEETTTMIVEVVTEINTERERPASSTEAQSTENSSTEITETPPSEIRESSSEENSDSNEVITQETTRVPSPTTTRRTTTSRITTTEAEVETEVIIETVKESTTPDEKIVETTENDDSTEEVTTEITTKSVNDLEDLTSFAGEVTTEASSRVLTDEAGSGAAVAIAVSTIGVIALILLVGLLLVVRRRGRRGVYAQRCTPVSLDAYSLDSVSVGHRKGNHRLRASKRSYGNPAYDDEVTSHPMQYAALANFAMDVESMTAEFAEIPTVSVRPDEVPPGCEDKNRYSNVLPLPETRVPLKRIGNDLTSEYINANFITGPGNIRNYYIACQAPLPNTVVDFWRMIWEHNSRVVVMLTEYMENGVEKCYEYLPPSEVSDNKRTFGDFQIVLMKREQRDKYAISSVQLINLATRTWREITHLWYFWPAKGVPDDYESVIDFLSEMRSYMKISQTAKEYDEEGVEVIYGDQSRSSFHNLSKLRSDDNGSGNGVNVYSPAKAEEQLRRGVTNGTLGRMKAAAEVEGVRPCVVVCASGAGRSAAVIAADICARALAAAAADVPRVVREIRAQRPHSLSNRHHYIFLYKLLSEYGNKLMGGGVDTI